MPTNKLRDAQCRGAKAMERPYKLFDGGGLHLFVSPTGAKTWRVAYRLLGKPKTMSFGPYPDVSLAEAREKLAGVKAVLRQGGDPMRKKPGKRGVTFRDAVGAYWEGRKDVTDGYRADALRGLEMYLFPALGGTPIGTIGRDDLMAALQRLDAAGRHVYVRKMRIWASQVFDWAVENGYSTQNPAALIRPEKAFGRAIRGHFAALALAETPEFLDRLAMEHDLNSVLACRMLALTWTRTIELRMMEWREIDGDTWIIPAGKMK
ncbi:MAG: integrase arm-type DNA-binding domain-containing protein, partial [Candidatus Accumulibacter sp.]|nr:integrase arm-type DNA-binding domain-containing protein [Accumulibacter sp.]